MSFLLPPLGVSLGHLGYAAVGWRPESVFETRNFGGAMQQPIICASNIFRVEFA